MLRIICVLIGCILLYGCAPTKHLKDGQYLLRSSKVKLTTDRTLADKGALNDQLSLLMQQKPNTYFLGFIPFKSWLYNMRYKRYQHDTANFQIASRTVEAPVVFDSNLVKRSESLMESFLNNQGYFYPDIKEQVKYDDKLVKLTYLVNTSYSFLIDSVSYEGDNEEILQIIKDAGAQTLLKKKTPYSNTLAGTERNRIANAVRNKGFYRFSAENIFFELDTFHTVYFQFQDNLVVSALNFINQRKNKKPSLDIKVVFNKGRDSLSYNKYSFNRIVVLPDYTDTSDIRDTNNLIIKKDKGIEFRYHKYYVSSNILRNKIAIKPGQYYSQENYDKTISQLNDLGIFQYVRLRYLNNRQDSLNQTLNSYILLSPAKKYDFNTSVEVSGGDLYSIGTAANVSVVDKNFLKGANQLTSTVSYGIELSDDNKKQGNYFNRLELFSQNFGINFSLLFPKFLLPVSQDKFSPGSVPRSILNVGFNSLIRSKYFTLQTINASFGYTWKETKTKTWTVRPIFINTLHLSNISDTFQLKLDTVPALRNSYQETFVEGENVEFIFNNELVQPYRNSFLRLAFEEAGGLLSGINAISKLGFNYANYVRVDFDTRQYFKYKNSTVALRFYGGVGLPYSNSKTLPYIKQYFVGGAYSIRGWRPRVLGPGSYYNPAQQNSVDNLFIDQSGDIKLEMNAEYRFAMLRLFAGALSLNGALFADAGNIWLAKEDATLPGANFQFKTLYQDIAMSTGAGLRIDLGGFLLVRLDWAFPVKKPYILNNNGWVFNEIKFGDPDWRRQNLNFSFAIGYPF